MDQRKTSCHRPSMLAGGADGNNAQVTLIPLFWVHVSACHKMRKERRAPLPRHGTAPDTPFQEPSQSGFRFPWLLQGNTAILAAALHVSAGQTDMNVSHNDHKLDKRSTPLVDSIYEDKTEHMILFKTARG